MKPVKLYDINMCNTQVPTISRPTIENVLTADVGTNEPVTFTPMWICHKNATQQSEVFDPGIYNFNNTNDQSGALTHPNNICNVVHNTNETFCKKSGYFSPYADQTKTHNIAGDLIATVGVDPNVLWVAPIRADVAQPPQPAHDWRGPHLVPAQPAHDWRAAVAQSPLRPVQPLAAVPQPDTRPVPAHDVWQDRGAVPQPPDCVWQLPPVDRQQVPPAPGRPVHVDQTPGPAQAQAQFIHQSQGLNQFQSRNDNLFYNKVEKNEFSDRQQCNVKSRPIANVNYELNLTQNGTDITDLFSMPYVGQDVTCSNNGYKTYFSRTMRRRRATMLSLSDQMFTFPAMTRLPLRLYSMLTRPLMTSLCPLSRNLSFP